MQNVWTDNWGLMIVAGILGGQLIVIFALIVVMLTRINMALAAWAKPVRLIAPKSGRAGCPSCSVGYCKEHGV